MATKSAYWIF